MDWTRQRTRFVAGRATTLGAGLLPRIPPLIRLLNLVLPRHPTWRLAATSNLIFAPRRPDPKALIVGLTLFILLEVVVRMALPPSLVRESTVFVLHSRGQVVVPPSVRGWRGVQHPADDERQSGRICSLRQGLAVLCT